MAVDPNVQAGSQFEDVIAQEAAFGTAITDAASFIRLDQKENSNFDLSGLTDDDTPRMDGTNVAQNTDRYFTTAGGTIVKPFNPVATLNTIDLFIAACMQDIESEGVSTPFAKVFTWDDATTRPDFASDVGFFFTVVQKNPIANRDFILPTCIIPALTFTDDPGTNGGRLTLAGNWFSGMTSLFNKAGSQSIAGGTDPDLNFFNGCLKTTKQFGGVDLVMPSWNLALDNKAARVGCNGVGDAESYAVGVNKYAATGSFKALYDNNTKAIIDNFMTSAFDTQLVIGYGSGNDPADTTGDLLFKLNVGVAQPQKDFSAVEGTMVDIPFVCRSDGTNPAVEIEIANAIDRSWTA